MHDTDFGAFEKWSKCINHTQYFLMNFRIIFCLHFPPLPHEVPQKGIEVHDAQFSRPQTLIILTADWDKPINPI
jgi:hypothetical protein